MTKIQKLQEALRTLDVDCALISSELNQRYLSGFNYSDGYIIVTLDKAYLLADFRYIEAAKAAVKDLDVIRPESTMIEGIKDIIRKNGIQKIAIEETSVSCADYQKFSKEFEGCTLLSGASEVLRSLRMVKDAEELDKIAKAQQITDLAFEHILGYISTDLTEMDIALELEFFMRRHGAEGLAFNTIAVSGASSSLPHGVPENVKLREGFLTMDFGAKYDGYCSDMTRTIVIGKADEDMKKVYNTVLSAQLAALDFIREGVSCLDADSTARNIIREAGFGSCFGHSLGHGVGMFIHESPSLSPRADEKSVLKRGHVVTVEPGIYIEGKYGCRIEDMIAIDLDGSVRNFTKSPKALIEI